MNSINLTPKQQKFVQEYIITGNATKAYKLAYDTSCMKPTTINRKAKECLDHGKISARITQLRSAMAKRAQIDQDMLTEEYARIAFLNYRIFFDDQGQLIPESELNTDAAAAGRNYRWLLGSCAKELKVMATDPAGTAKVF